MKILLVVITFVLFSTQEIEAHPDGAIPYWYPASYIYGFVDGCAETIEISGVYSDRFWPNEIRSLCGCVIDSLRHSLTFEEISSEDKQSNVDTQMIVSATMPICIQEKLNEKWKKSMFVQNVEKF